MYGLAADKKKQANIFSMLVLFVSVWAVSIPISRAVADDSMARVAAGGITFVESKDVRTARRKSCRFRQKRYGLDLPS